MKVGSKLVLAFLGCLMVLVVAYRFKEYVVERNFLVLASVECTPESENCFLWDCSPEEEPDCDRTPYGKIQMVAHEAPNCLLENNCEEFVCEEYSSCDPVICSEETLAPWEACILPEEYSETLEGSETEPLILEDQEEN